MTRFSSIKFMVTSALVVFLMATALPARDKPAVLALEGKPAPEIALPTLDGKPFKLLDAGTDIDDPPGPVRDASMCPQRSLEGW